MPEITTGTLYLVATPIGNLGDISRRAAKVLGEIDFIAAEDTRVTRKLLEHLGIKKTLVSYYEHNRKESGEKILSRILSGENCALVTDAGTPGISDPGEELVRMCAEAGVTMVAIPGPCAAIAALALSGLPSGRFTFEGFLSTARKSRFEHLDDLKTEKRTMVFYEAPHKLMRTLYDILSVLGDRRISISRELTKIYEETLRCAISEAIAHFETNPPRGELVLVIEGACDLPSPSGRLDEAITSAKEYINDGLSVKDAVKKASEETKTPKNTLYNAVVKHEKNENSNRGE
ncbi:MAG: 16S rRNA (cytidine(1402)-2'-O)-methyltransferase [Oscillospiraceae bacterium]|jgi:16S rRNA (cytidine1402-2'-O)-methyltransferase|nr:16S rRNA (cytidine(1402)-2'-O)-methyltransferase [Oscillospiraceae bacterium]